MKILVGTDFSDSSRNALRYAANLALKANGELLLAHVFQSMKPTGKMGLNFKIREDAEEAMVKLVEEVKASVPGMKNIKSTVIKGEAHKKLEILAKREKADYLVIGARGERDAENIFLGNIAGKIVQLADFPLILIPEKAQFEELGQIVCAIKRTSVKEKESLSPLRNLIDKFDSRLTVLQVNEDIKRMTIGEHLSILADSLVTIESPKFYKPIEEFVNNGDFNMVCVIRRKRGFFHKFLLSKSFLKSKFNISKPLLILQGQKD